MVRRPPVSDVLRDRLAISDLVNTYAQGVDRKDIDGVCELFSDRGVLAVVSAPGVEPRRIEGREAIRESLGDLHRYKATFHATTSHTAVLHGDRATAETGCVAHHVTGEDGSERDRVWYLRYTDSLVREDGQWRFAERELRVEIVTKGPLVIE
jgi:uncharacterized protein (TIGR02246 family)